MNSRNPTSSTLPRSRPPSMPFQLPSMRPSRRRCAGMRQRATSIRGPWPAGAVDRWAAWLRVAPPEPAGQDDAMEYRTLGRTGCVVSRFALGTMTFGAETDQVGAHRQLDAFVEAGGTFIDTADVYSAGVSEQIVGAWLSDRPVDVTGDVVLTTKGRFPMGPGRNDLGNSR